MVKSLVIWVIRVPWQSKQNGAAVDVSAEIVSYSYFYWKKYDCNWVTKLRSRYYCNMSRIRQRLDKVSLVLWSTVSQNLRPLGAARTMWVYFALCQQSTLKRYTFTAVCPTYSLIILSKRQFSLKQVARQSNWSVAIRDSVWLHSAHNKIYHTKETIL